MIIISHRGNLNGREVNRENKPDFIVDAANAGFDVEVDVWCIGSKLLLGHDIPQYEITGEWLSSLPLWCHAKNEDALSTLLSLGLHCFWHETDRFTLTSRGIPWCYPNNYCKNGVTVLDKPSLPPIEVLGVCTDYPMVFRKREFV